MFVKKYFHNTLYYQNQLKAQEQIITELRKIKIIRGDDVLVPMSYLIKVTKIEKKIIYNLIENLINLDMVEKFLVSSCPICLEGNIHKYESEQITCKHCRERYSGDDIIEKYRLKD